MRTVDINADLGEGFPNDARLLTLVTSASLCCGAHAADRETILATLEMAKAHNVPVGAHPGYADRDNFGRTERAVKGDEVQAMIITQIGFLAMLAQQVDVPILFVKPHGALYNQAQGDEEIAQGVVDAVRRLDIPLLGQPGSVLERLARSASVRFVAEGFPDRRYEADGRLVPRSRPDAILHDPADVEAQVVRLVSTGLTTLCIHGDDPRAVANAETIRAILDRQGIQSRFWG